jgi:hypothetical protein
VKNFPPVTPAEAGVPLTSRKSGIPAFAGMTSDCAGWEP